MAQNDGQLLAFTSSSGSPFAAATAPGVLSGLLTPTPGSTFTSYVAPNANGQDYGFGYDLANSLYFEVQVVYVGTVEYYALDSYSSRTGSANPVGQVLIGQARNLDNIGPFVVDPLDHSIYAYTFTGTGLSDDTQQQQIFRVSYNSSTGALGSTPYDPTQVDSNGFEVATQSSGNAQVVVSTQSDATFNGAKDIQLDSLTNQLVYLNNNPEYVAGTQGNPGYHDYPAQNAIFMVSASGSNNQQTQITSSTQFATDAIETLAIDPVRELIYFSTVPRSGTGGSKLWVIPMSSPGTQATDITPSGWVSPDISNSLNVQNLVFDPTSHQLYFYANGASTSTGTVYQVGLSQDGLSTTGSVTSYADAPLDGSSSSIRSMLFDSLPVLMATGTTAAAVQNGAALTLLTGPTAVTDPDGGGFLQSASVTLTNGKTGDVLSINGTAFGSGNTTYTDATSPDATKPTFTIAYSNYTLTITSPVGTNGVTDTDADYAHLLSEVQYRDGSSDTTARNFVFQVNDGAYGTPSGTNTVQTSVRIETPPTVTSTQVSVLEGASATGPSGAALTGDVNSGTGTSSGLTVTAVQFGGQSYVAGTAVTGTYGTLTVSADGSYTYIANNAAAIDGASTSAHPVESGFTYTVSDGTLSTQENFTATIDRPPAAAADTNAAVAAGAVVSGNVLTNDADPDGDTKTVSGFAQGGTTGVVGQVLHGTYGDLMLSSNGAYTYRAGVTQSEQTAITHAAAGQHPTDVFTYIDSDGHGGSASSTLSIAVDRAPSITLVPTSVTYATGTNGVHLQTGAAISDSDGDNAFTGATVTLTGGYSGDGDQLSLAGSTGTVAVDGHGYSVAYSGAGTNSEVLTVTGAGTAQNYQDILDQIVFNSTAPNPTNGGSNATRTATYTLTDADGATGNATGSETITVELAPTVASVTATTSNGSSDINDGQTVTIAVQFSQSVTVTGHPTLQLIDNLTASYNAQSSDGATLYFLYAVAPTDNEADLTVQSLSLNGGTIQNSNGTAAVTSGAAKDLHIQVDTAAPGQPNAPTLSPASDTGVQNDNDTSATTPTVTGTAESGSTVRLYDTDGTTLLGTAVATGGTYSITSSALADGTHTLTVTATDAAGNTGTASNPLALTIDTAAPGQPNAPTLSPASDTGVQNDNDTGTTTPTVTGTAESGSTVRLYD
ncbi:MAG: beta strand repeat-containing protein, partial [Janthinobacterium lividum]